MQSLYTTEIRQPFAAEIGHKVNQLIACMIRRETKMLDNIQEAQIRAPERRVAEAEIDARRELPEAITRSGAIEGATYNDDRLFISVDPHFSTDIYVITTPPPPPDEEFLDAIIRDQQEQAAYRAHAEESGAVFRREVSQLIERSESAYHAEERLAVYNGIQSEEIAMRLRPQISQLNINFNAAIHTIERLELNLNVLRLEYIHPIIERTELNLNVLLLEDRLIIR